MLLTIAQPKGVLPDYTQQGFSLVEFPFFDPDLHLLLLFFALDLLRVDFNTSPKCIRLVADAVSANEGSWQKRINKELLLPSAAHVTNEFILYNSID